MGALLDQNTAFGSQGVDGAQDDGGFGEYFVDLRNLNFDRTLVLVNGQRFVPSGIQTDEAVDLNDIPDDFVDHITVRADGSELGVAPDAVAGVVDVVLKTPGEGLNLTAYGGGAGAGGDGTGELSLTGGHSFGATRIAFGLDTFTRQPVSQSDRFWAADPIASAARGPDGPLLTYGSAATLGGHAVGLGVDAEALGGGRSAAFDPSDDFNAAPDRYLQGGLQRRSGYAEITSALSQTLSASLDVLLTDRQATTLLPPQSLGLTGTEKHPDGFTIPGSDPFNPFGTAVTLERVVGEAGAQQTVTSGPVWRVVAGLNGRMGDWGWSLTLDRGQSVSDYATDNEINLTRALQTAGNGACPAASGCVEADWFGAGRLSAPALAYITYTGRSRAIYSDSSAVGSVAGPAFALPGGPAMVTLGAEARGESGATSVDPVTEAGDQAGNDAAATRGGYQSDEAYATLLAPLLRNGAAARRLDLTLAARGTETSRYGGFATLRGELDYEPVAGVHLRAVSATARRPPAISEAFGGITGAPQPVADPCARDGGLRANATVNANCLAQGLAANFMQASPTIEVESGGNASLRPEQAENESLGIALDPVAWPLSLNVDWYHYRIRDAIDSLEDTDPDLVPDLCYESTGLSSPLCKLITRIGGGGDAGQISNILGLDENVGTIKEDGFDFGATLRAPATRFGAGQLDWQTNWLLNYKLHDFGTRGFAQYAGTFPGLAGVGSYARVRSRASLAWSFAEWSVLSTARFISGGRVLGDAEEPFSKARGVVYQDIELGRRFGRFSVSAGIDNIADTRPPTLIDGQTNTSTATYDVVGRFVWGRLGWALP